MKKIFASILAAGALTASVYGQCANDNVLWQTYGTLTSGSISVPCQFPGEYSTVGVVAGTTYTFSTCGSSYDTQITLYNHGTGAFVAYNDDAMCGASFTLQSNITWTATFTGTLRVLTDQYFCSSASTCTSLLISASGGSTPSPCASTTNLTCGSTASYSVSGSGAGWNNGPWGTPGAEKVFTFTAPTTGVYNITVSNSEYYVDLFQSTSCGPTGWTYLNDVYIGTEVSAVTLTAGVTYYFLLDDENTSASSGTISISCPAPASPCSTAPTITCGSTVTGNTVGGATVSGLPTCAGYSVGTGGQRWYRFVGTGSLVTASMCFSTTTYDSKLHVYTGSCGALTCVTADDDACITPGLASTVSWCAAAGQVYYLVVNGFGSAEGPYALNISCGAGAASIGSLTATCVGGATQSLTGSPAGGTFSGPGVSGSTFNPAVAGVGTHTITYTYCGASASTTVTVSGGPANDLCSNATTWVGSTMAFTTVCATGSDITSCTFNDFNDVWFRWTAPSCGQVTFSTCGLAGFDTHLSLFTSCAGGELACNDDFCGLQSSITANVTAGTTYYVRAAGYNGAQGSGSISVSMSAPLAGSASAASTYACGYNVSCAGACDGAAVAAGSGGIAPYSYSWSSGSTSSTASGLCAGSYTVTITDAIGCTTVRSVTLTAPAAVTVNAGPNTTVIYGYPSALNCATLTATGIGGGCGPYTISWSNGATTASTTVCPSVTTDYTVTVTDANGCTASDVVRVCVVDVRCGDDLNKISVCHIPPGNQSAAHTICIGYPAVAAHLAHGDYLGACGAIYATCDDAGSTAKSAEAPSSSMTAAPNPFSTSTSIEFTLGSTDNATLKVYDLRGNVIATLFDGGVEAGQKMSFEFGSANLASGIYMARLVTAGGEMQTVKLVIQK